LARCRSPAGERACWLPGSWGTRTSPGRWLGCASARYSSAPLATSHSSPTTTMARRPSAYGRQQSCSCHRSGPTHHIRTTTSARALPLHVPIGHLASPTTQLRFECPGYTGGTSGSPWVTRFSHWSRTGTIVGVIGGHQGGGDTPSVSYSVRFGPAIQRLYREAKAESIRA